MAQVSGASGKEQAVFPSTLSFNRIPIRYGLSVGYSIQNLADFCFKCGYVFLRHSGLYNR
jgi:hypothetical protein